VGEIKLNDSSKPKFYTVIIASLDNIRNTISIISNCKGKKIQGLCVIDQNLQDSYIDNILVRANIDNVINWLQTEIVDEVVINISNISDDIYLNIENIIRDIKSMGIKIYINIDKTSSFSKKYEDEKNIVHFQKNKFAVISINSQHKMTAILKRAIDISGAIVGLIISIPIVTIVAIPLKLESKGPLLFKQQRVGRNGRIFTMYKLRSMYNDAEQRKQTLMEQNEMKGLMFKIKDDPRITKVGKFIRKTSIDELPQFWNVLMGNMSLVGTRPPTLDEYKQYKPYHKRRLSIKPGITGIWQVSGRSDIEDFEDVVKMDLKYIDEWSLSMEFKVLLTTIIVVFKLKGAR